MNCWNCQAEAEAAPCCPSCGKVQLPSPSASHFDRLGLPTAFALDGKILDAKFREWSLKLHPDRFAQADAKERLLSLEQTTALNEAYRVLKDPLRRANYLLKLRGVDLEKDDASAKNPPPTAFLEEIISLRESLDEALSAKDLNQARALSQDVEGRRSTALERAISALAKEGRENTQTAADALIQVRYFTRFLEEAESLEEEAL